MSEPARSLPPHEAGRPAPGPLRDWLAAMRAHAPAAPAEQTVQSRPALRPEPVRQEPPRPEPARSEPTWSPRLVQVEPPPVAEEEADIAALMAENLTLKARLQVETDRQSELQTLLAAEIRELRRHVQDEMNAFQGFRAERDRLYAERDSFAAERDRLRAGLDALQSERDGLRADRDAGEAERTALREERDLWQARSEALAQPIFQLGRR